MQIRVIFYILALIIISCELEKIQKVMFLTQFEMISRDVVCDTLSDKVSQYREEFTIEEIKFKKTEANSRFKIPFFKVSPVFDDEYKNAQTQHLCNPWI
ncbi:hypothetical protein CNO14_04370 (plasmid) [Borrelia miyamotoi]|uniref:Lipoprotein n=1 Tax=Borrelia miyamotoi TaxID=47466 RepID=A0AAP8YSD6_9SPIR|nr:hypothetical protein [Borrelia miyamotoi]AHH05445.1 Hypothetical protein BOM_0902 [Borrelia miyamotoi FR64b]ATQ15242.1 hypothetical protein CNO14_04370 [Borrelia miyamotoi]ATQ16446.1 hypothetical protein CNO13_04495 [Borrelia miyamotoi]ATQ17571.1 hypothetical protein CNO12_04375 [Borrelia miyamotoi]ATQ18815.1 hypothetical protein CNO11_04365 [Borrelia miyamotoi]